MADNTSQTVTKSFPPTDWVETTLGEVVEITSSKRIFANEYQTSGVPFFRGKEVTEKFNGNEISTELFITEEKYNEIKNHFGVPEENDILLTSVGTLGNPYLVEKGFKFYFKDGNLTWFRKYKNIVPKWLYYWIISPQGKEILSYAKIGSTQEAYTIVKLKNLEILLPPLPEQKAIASVLSSFDDKIELLREQNKTLEEIGQTIFKEWFLPSRQAGELPEGWRVGKLGEEFDITIGRTPPRAESQWFSDTPIGKKWISIKDIGNSGTYIFDTSEYLIDEAIEKFNIPVIPENTTILSFKMTVGKLTITTEEMLSNEAIAHLKLKDNSILSSEFIYSYLQNLDFNALGSTSSIVTAINSTMIKNLEVIIPDPKTLKQFDEAIQPIFSKIRDNSEQIQSLARSRDEFLPKLMSGQVRVSL
jgi:type I restriction enzyme S subunit